MIPYGRHFLDEADIAAVVDVLRNGNLTQGPKVQAFENVIAEYVGAKYAVAVSNGTTALHLAYLSLDVGIGDQVVTTPNTFVATANAAAYTGADIHFADIDASTLNLDPLALEKNCASLNNVKAIAAVHFGGLPCDMIRINEVANRFGASVVEDAAHALGACYADGQRVGCCVNSDVTTFSFHPVKMIAAGEGGMITTNDEEIYRRLIRLRSHGINKGDDQFLYLEASSEQGEANPWYYEMQELGYNYRITDIQCALALSQMKKLEKFISRRQELAVTYDEFFQNFPRIQSAQPIALEGFNARHLYVIRIDFAGLGISRCEYMARLRQQGIGSQVHYIPVHLHPFYRNKGFCPGDFPVAEAYYQEALSIPLYYGLTDEQQALVLKALQKAAQ